MIWLPVIETIISLVFTFLIISVITSAIYDFISERRNFKGKLQEKFLLRAFYDPTNRLPNFGYQILQHPLIRSQTIHTQRKIEKIQPDVFVKVYKEVAQDFINLQPMNSHKMEPGLNDEQTTYIPEGVFKSFISETISDTQNKIFNSSDPIADNVEENRIKTWYESLTNFMSYQYKRKTRMYLFIIGLFVAISFNIDTVYLIDRFWNDAALRKSINAAAESFLENAPQDEKGNLDTEELLDRLDISNSARFKNNDSINIIQYTSSLPVGWKDFRLSKSESIGTWIKTLISMLLGWFITAAALTFGAPFWYDVLRQLFHIKSLKVSGS